MNGGQLDLMVVKMWSLVSLLVRSWNLDGGIRRLENLTSNVCFLAFCEYILMAPSEEYRPFMDAMKEKTYIGKVND